MIKEVLRNAGVVAIGIVFVLDGRWYGWVVIILGAASLAWTWHLGYMPPIDPQFLADVDRSMDIEKSDPATAGRLLDRAVDDSDLRRAQRYADLHRRAKTDRLAAVELRNRLRYELKLTPAVRKKAEEFTITPSDRAEALKVIDRQASDTRKQLAEVEKLLIDYPFYMEWRDQATEYLTSFQSLPSGGASASAVTLIAGAGILAILGWMRMGSEGQVRIGVSGVGALIAILGAVRPASFWESASVEALREMLGDRTVVMISISIAVLIIVAAWRLHF